MPLPGGKALVGTYKDLECDAPATASSPATDTNHGINEDNKGLSPEPSGWVRR